MNERIKITLTDDQMRALKEIETKTRYEAMEEVAKILGAKTAQKRTWASSRKTIIIDKDTICEITFSKGKVLELQYYHKSEEYYKGYYPIDVKHYKGDK